MYIYDEQNNQWIRLRDTAPYQRRKRQVRDGWIILGLVLIVLPLAAQVGLALLATLLSFSYLDEVPYAEFQQHKD